jgi:hypothetical protein
LRSHSHDSSRDEMRFAMPRNPATFLGAAVAPASADGLG